MTDPIKALLIVLAFTLGIFIGSNSAKHTIQITRHDYDIVKNDAKCASHGGQIVAQLHDWNLPNGFLAVSYECRVPEKTIEL
jgi:Co/Zn/Cd efflux system component